MADKKLKLLIVLGIAAVISITYGIMAPTRSQQAARAKPKAALKTGTSEERAERAATGRRRLRSVFESWGRDPFKLRGTGGEPTSSVELCLNGIVYKQHNPKAMINDNIVGIGNKIGGCTVIDIKPDRVIINDGAKDITLKLEE